MRRALRSPVVALLFLAPFLAEALPGATPPIFFVLLPPIAAWQIGLYGCGALLVREAVRRWRGGWRSILLLGAAYALVEEGLSLKVIFNTSFEPAGALATYGRVGEIATVFLVQLIVYHAVVSITLPIMLAELMFQEQRERTWLGRRGLLIAGSVFLAALVFGYAVVHAEPPPPAPYAVVWLAVVALIVAAHRAVVVPTARPMRPTTRRLVGVFLLSLVGTTVFLGVTWSGPDSGRPAALTILLQLIVVIGCGLVLRRFDKVAPLDPLEQLALISGVAGVFALTDLTKPAGAPLVALVFVLALAMLARRLRRQRAQPFARDALPG